MRTWIPGLAILVAAAGCESKPEVGTGKAFLDRFQQAEKTKDAQAMWGLLTKESRETLVASARKEIEEKKSGEKDAEKVAREKWAKQVESRPTDLLNAKFVEERTQAEQVILVVEVPEKGKREIPLVREDGGLHVKWDEKSGI